jgi:hypothetical protein
LRGKRIALFPLEPWMWLCVTGLEMEALMRCAFCQQPVDPKSSWRSTSGQFFCTEYCAEVESMEPAAMGLKPAPQQPEPLPL